MWSIASQAADTARNPIYKPTARIWTEIMYTQLPSSDTDNS